MGTLLARLDRVSVHRGHHEVLREIDLDVPTGRVLALLGPSGAGKSTLLAVLAGQLAPSAGTIRWTQPPARVGVVTQAPHLFPWLTVADNVGLGLRYAANRPASGGGPFRRAGSGGAAAGVAEPSPPAPSWSRLGVTGLLERFELAELAERYPDELSGGQAQRVSLARTLVIDPDLVLLDEPFSALDPATRTDLGSWYADHARQAGRTTVLVTHDVDEALALADRIALLGAQGRLTRTWELTPQDPAGADADRPQLRAQIHAAFTAADEPRQADHG